MYTTLTMAPNNGVHQHHSVIPSLPTMPSPGGNDNQWSWMIVVCLGAGWVAPRQPWDDGGCHGLFVRVSALFVSVLCDVYVDDIAIVTENRLKGISNDKIV